MASYRDNELFRVFYTLEYEENGHYEIESARNVANGLELIIRIKTGRDETPFQQWRILCEQEVANRLVFHYCNDFPDLVDNHPLLWPYVEPMTQLWFYSASSVQPFDVIGKLVHKHAQLVEEHISFGEYLNGFKSLAKLIGGRHGKLADGPHALIAGYEQVLADCGFKTSTKTLHKFWNGNIWEDKPRDLKVLLLEDSHVVAEEFHWERVDQADEPSVS